MYLKYSKYSKFSASPGVLFRREDALAEPQAAATQKSRADKSGRCRIQRDLRTQETAQGADSDLALCMEERRKTIQKVRVCVQPFRSWAEKSQWKKLRNSGLCGIHDRQ